MRHALLLLSLALTGMVRAETCTIDLKGDDAMKFDKSEITVSASCKTITIQLAHAGKLPLTTMGHNVVIAAAADIQSIGMAGATAGATAHYVPVGDPRVIAHTTVVGGGAKTSVTFPGSALKAGGDYAFFCTFPGHWAIMKGKLIVQ